MPERSSWRKGASFRPGAEVEEMRGQDKELLPDLIWEEVRAPGYPNSGATEERKPPTGLDQYLGTDFGEASYPELAEEKETPSLHLNFSFVFKATIH